MFYYKLNNIVTKITNPVKQNNRMLSIIFHTAKLCKTKAVDAMHHPLRRSSLQGGFRRAF